MERLESLAAGWAGVSLEGAAPLGMREYRGGARLLTHVERPATAAVSAIINVAQRGMREPWPLQIYDFAGRLHEVSMEPGDIVYYESARCLHGRMKPLNGSAYVSLLVHFTLKDGDADWHTRPNPADAPAPLRDAEGVCSVDAAGGAGAFSSCGGRALQRGEDIFQYWLDHVTHLSDAA